MQGDKAGQRKEEGKAKKSSLTSRRTEQSSAGPSTSAAACYVYMLTCRLKYKQMT